MGLFNYKDLFYVKRVIAQYSDFQNINMALNLTVFET